MNVAIKKDLFTKRVNVLLNDGQTIVGDWSEWWNEDDNSYLADDGLPVYESILIDTDVAPIEIATKEIKDIRKA